MSDCIRYLNRTLVISATSALAASCSSPTAPGPDSLKDDVQARTGVALGWNAPTADSLLIWDGTAPLSADTAVRLAIAFKPELRAMAAEVVAAQAEVRQSALAPNPMIDLGLGVPLNMGATPIVAMAFQNLAFLARRDAMIDEASKRLGAQLLALTSAAVDTAARARSAHATAATAQQLAQLATRKVELTGAVLDAARSSYAAGELTRGQWNTASRGMVEAQTERLEAQRARFAARLVLLETIGRSADEAEFPIELPPRWLAPLPPDDTALAALVKRRRPDVQAELLKADALSAAVAVAEGSRVETFALGAGYERDMERDEAVALAMRLELPVFDDGSVRIERARAMALAARERAEAVTQTAITQARLAFSAMDAAFESYGAISGTSLQELLDTAAAANTAAGRGDVSQVSAWEAELLANAAVARTAQAERDLLLGRIEVERSLGGASWQEPASADTESAP